VRPPQPPPHSAYFFRNRCSFGGEKERGIPQTPVQSSEGLGLPGRGPGRSVDAGVCPAGAARLGAAVAGAPLSPRRRGRAAALPRQASVSFAARLPSILICVTHLIASTAVKMTSALIHLSNHNTCPATITRFSKKMGGNSILQKKISTEFQSKVPFKILKVFKYT